MKKLLRNLHLYLGLTSGLVIMITCLTGATLVFEKELQHAFYHGRYYVQPLQHRFSLEQVVNNLKNKYPKATITGFKIYKDPTRTIEAGISLPGEWNHQKTSKNRGSGKLKEQATTGLMLRPTHTAFVNPFNGEVAEVYVYKETWFYKVFALHRWLLGSNTGIGKYIVGVSTFIFIFILITGILLWWPKTKRILLQRLKIKADSGWKRLNHDLHIVTGFYCSIFLLIFAVTAMSWSFKWFNEAVYAITNSTPETPPPPLSGTEPGNGRVTIDDVYLWATKNFNNHDVFDIRMPKDPGGTFEIALGLEGSNDSKKDIYYLDPYSGKLLGQLKFQDRNLGQRVRAHIKPLHTGSIFGFPSKIIAFITCLFGVSFPVTGTIMWINRNKKDRKSF